MIDRCRTVWCGLALVTCTVAMAAQEPPAKAALRELSPKVASLRANGESAEAIAACEAFLKRFPDVPPYTRSAVVMINNVVSQDLSDSAARLAVYRRAYEQFARAPEYYSLGAINVARDMLHSKHDAAGAEVLVKAAMDKLGAKLAVDSHVGYYLFIVHLQTVLAAERFDEGLRLARGYAERSPWMLGDRGFLKAVCDLADAKQDPEVSLSAARTYYGLCEFSDLAVQEATDLAAFALKATGGVGAVRQFAEAQEDARKPSPLRQVALFDLGRSELMAQAADGDLEAELNVLLYQGDIEAALEKASALLRRSSTLNPYYTARALGDLARCFKARDLALPRANAFLEWHSTGAGRNPLDDLRVEVVAGSGAVP